MQDCNLCRNINVTEEEQEIIYRYLGIFKSHHCMKYNRGLKHEGYVGVIPPCKECVEDCLAK